MPDSKNRSSLEEIGFRELGTWQAYPDRLAYLLLDEGETTIDLLDAPNALYAFCRGDEVLYVGKTTRSIRSRFKGYCRPSSTQRTNMRCNALIREALSQDETISILAFSPSDKHQYAGFPINLAAGLEDALIAHFEPPWNGAGPGRRPITETAAIEAEETSVAGSNEPVIPDQAQRPAEQANSSVPVFTVKLGPTYYEGDIINPGVAMVSHFGAHGEEVTIFFSDGSPALRKKITRTANGPRNIRLQGSAAGTRAWIRKHFQPGDVLTIRILGPHAIEMLAPQAGSPEELGRPSS